MSTRGRRPGPTTTKQDIAIAARELFAQLGYEGTTMRAIARRANVDPALVSHHFGSKRDLFAAVVEPPIDLGQALPALMADDPDRVGERLAQLVVAVLGNDEARERIIGMVRAASSGPDGAAAVRAVVSERVLGALTGVLDGDDAGERAALVGAQVIGVVVARHIVGVEPLRSMDDDRLVAYLAPVLQRYVAGGPSRS